MQLNCWRSEHFQGTDHETNERHVLGKVRVRANGSAQRGVLTMTKADAVATAQLDHAHAEDCINEAENGEIRGGDKWWMHAFLPVSSASHHLKISGEDARIS